MATLGDASTNEHLQRGGRSSCWTRYLIMLISHDISTVKFQSSSSFHLLGDGLSGESPTEIFGSSKISDHCTWFYSACDVLQGNYETPCGPRKDVAAFITFFLLKVVGTSLASLPDEKDVNESSTHHAWSIQEKDRSGDGEHWGISKLLERGPDQCERKRCHGFGLLSCPQKKLC